MLFLNHLTTLDPISCWIWCGRLLCGFLPLTIDINEPSLQIKHAKHDRFYFVHKNEISHLNIQVINQASQKNTPWNKATMKSSSLGAWGAPGSLPIVNDFRDELAHSLFHEVFFYFVKLDWRLVCLSGISHLYGQSKNYHVLHAWFV